MQALPKVPEVPLPGERGVVRVGDTVRRPAAGPAVHALLRFLEQADFPCSPRVLGVDERGREVLSYLPGVSGRHGWAQVVPERGLRAFAELLRAYHDAVADFTPSVHAWALEPRPPRAGELICHGDFGPWNVVWDGGRPVGLLDFDFAGPAPALTDVAYALEHSVPFRDDDHCLRWLAYPSPPDRRARLETFAGRRTGLPRRPGSLSASSPASVRASSRSGGWPPPGASRRRAGWPAATWRSSPGALPSPRNSRKDCDSRPVAHRSAPETGQTSGGNLP